jgi:hypothetical protein
MKPFNYNRQESNHVPPKQKPCTSIVRRHDLKRDDSGLLKALNIHAFLEKLSKT